MLSILFCALLGLSEPACLPAANSTGMPGALQQTGETSFTASQLPYPGSFAGLFGGPEAVDLPFGDGRICITPALGWWRLPPAQPVINGSATFDAGGFLYPGGPTTYVQAWYRDPGYGNFGFNLTNRVTWVETLP
jgi:hypothetical protein